MNFLWYAGSFIVALAILVVVHEYGHYLAARISGVKVLRFAVGFGKTVWSIRRGKDGTEWAIAALPLGGYVKMLDEREGPVVPEELHRSFNRQPLSRRAFIVAAGPIANLLLAVFLYWLVFMHGTQELRPVLGEPPVGSVAAALKVGAGATATKVNGVAIQSWQDLRWEVLQRVMDREVVELELINPDQSVSVHRFDHDALGGQSVDKDPLPALGLLLYRPPMPAVIGEIVTGSAAARAGLMTGDKVLTINGEVIADWAQVTAIARSSPTKDLLVEVRRGEQRLQIAAMPDAVQQGDQTIGRLGIMVADDESMHASRFVTVSYPPVEALARALSKTWDASILTLRMMGRMLMGEISWKNISGPVTIADYAGQSASLGLPYYLGFLALISISLGVLNLLPIPVLDGGHLLYYFVEFIKGGPLSERVMEYGQQIGLVFLGLLMTFAFYNDLNRLITG